MNTMSIIRSAKVIAKVIESKSPGTCTEIIKDLDKASTHPVLVKQRVENLKELWNTHKTDFTESEIYALSSEAGFDLSDSSTWDSFIDSMCIMETMTGAVDKVAEAVDVESTGGILGDIFDFIMDLFS